MKKETLYLDTSALSAYYDERAKERQEATIKFWEGVLPNYKVFISEITIKELEDTKDETLRRKFGRLIKNFKVLKLNKKIRDLADAYIKRDVFPEKYIEDALHVAVASYYELSYLVSWNFEHLVKVKTRKSVNLVNILAQIIHKLCLLRQDIVFSLILGLRPPRYFASLLSTYTLYEYRQNKSAQILCPVYI